MSYLTLVITLPLTVFAVLFAVANTGDVTLGLWPLEKTYTLSLSVFGLGMLAAGFLLGGLFVWIHSQKLRFKYWQESRRAARLEKELDGLHAAKDKQATAEPAAQAAAAPLALPASSK